MNVLNPIRLHFILDMHEPQASFSPHFGIAYLSAYLKRKRPHVQVSVSYLSDGDISGDIRRIQPHLLGFTSTSRRFIRMRRMAEELHQTLGIPVLWGGVHLSIAPHDLPDCAAVGVLGEGEETLVELLDAFDGRHFHNLDAIPGITYRRDGVQVENPKRPPLANLDDVPFPDVALLRVSWRKLKRAVLITSRGCPYHCRFCASSVFWDRTRLHSARYVVDELAQVIRQDNVEEILIYDDFFTASKKRVAEIADLMEVEGLTGRVKIECLSRADNFDDQLAADMRRIGIEKVSFGFESGCQKTLDYLKNGKLTLERSRETVRIAKAHGMKVVGSFVIGSPYETEGEILETYAFIRSLKLDWVQVTIATPFPGTELWEDGKKLGVIPDDTWRDAYFAMFAFAELDNDGLTVEQFLSDKVLLSQIERTRFLELVMQARALQMEINPPQGPPPPPPPLIEEGLEHHVVTCIHLADALRREDRFDQAVAVATVAASAMRENPDLYHFVADLHAGHADLERSRDLLVKLLQRWPGHAKSLYLLGLIQLNRGDQANGIKLLQAAYHLNPGDRNTVVNLVMALKQTGQRTAFSQVILEHLHRFPKDEEVRQLAL